MAVGFGGTILTSSDGVTWASQTSNTTNPLYAVAYGSKWVAAGGAGTTVASTDATTWAAVNVGTSSDLHAVTASGSLFAAAGDAEVTGEERVYTSTDGATWTAHLTGDGNDPMHGAAYLGGAFYMASADGEILRSSDGSSWSPVVSRTPDFGGLAYGGSTYVAVGNFGAIWSSPDGLTWTARHAAYDINTLRNVVYGAGLAKPLFVAPVSTSNPVSGPTWYVLTSPDGVTWTQAASGPDAYPAGVAYGGPSVSFVIVGGGNGNKPNGWAFTSPDGVTWTRSANASTTINTDLGAVTYGGGQFVASGTGVYTSPDGVTWTKQSVPSTDEFGAIAFGNGTYVALDTQMLESTVLTSPNGITWTAHSVSFGNNTYIGGALAFANGAFLGSGLSTSTDGVTWTTPAGFPNVPGGVNGGIFASAAYAQGRWIGVGLAGTVVTHR